jgi:hypothetical protein
LTSAGATESSEFSLFIRHPPEFADLFIDGTTCRVYFQIMRIRRLLATSALTVLWASASLAGAHELSGAELRASVAAGQSKPLSEIIELVGRQVKGELVDARAYSVDGIFYRILLKTPDGKLVSAIIDARTGQFMSGRSDAAREITQAARGQSGWSPFGNQARGNSANSSNSSNAGGNGRGNSGGNNGGGGGNSGGGGGNSGGGGGGGGGNSGGKK